MKKHLKFLIPAAIVLLVLACKRERNFIPPNPKVTQNNVYASSIQQMKTQAMPAVQTYMIDASKSNTVVCNNGSQIFIPVGSLLLDGKPVTTGSINVQVRELGDKSAMIQCGITTQTKDNILESAGMIEFKAEVPTLAIAGKPKTLTIDSNRPLQIDLPIKAGAPNTNFESFYLDAKNLWVPAGDNAILISQSGQNFMRMPMRRCGWINCDRFYHYNPSYDIRVKVDSLMRDSCEVYVVVNYLRSAVQLFWDKDSSEFNVSCHGYMGFPDTATCTVIVQCMKNGKFYEKDMRIKPKKGLVLNLNPEPTNYKYFYTMLKTIFDGN